MKYDLYIKKDFTFNVEDKIVNTHLTSHLFHKRAGQKRYRSYMFSSVWQYQHILTSAFKEYKIEEYANKGRTVFVFKYLEDTFGMLLDIRYAEDEVFNITVITVDKLEERHFIKHEMFCKENNKIYSDYKLPVSYLNNIEKRIDRNVDYEVFYTRYFTSISGINTYLNFLDEIRVICSLVSRVKNESLPLKVVWIEVPVDSRKSFFIKISIEKIWRSNEEKIALIFTDFKFSKERMEMVKQGRDEELFLLFSEKYKYFGKMQNPKPLKNTGLKIKQKIQSKDPNIC